MKRTAQLGALLLALGALLLTTAGPALAASPTVSDVTVAAVGPTTATVAATVNLEGNSLATGLLTPNCYFSYGTTAPAAGSSPSGGAGSPTGCANTPAASGSTVVAANLTGLSQGTTYYINASVATGVIAGVLGTTTSSPDSIAFTTPSSSIPPSITGLSATTASATSSTLSASVNARNWPISSCTIEYGTSASNLGTTAKCPSTPSGATATAESLSITGLAPGTTYYYNVVVGYNSTTASGTTAHFTTPTAGTATNEGATSVTTTGATLNASVNPQGQAVTSCTFYYYTGKNAAVAAPCAQSAASLSGQNTSVPVTATLTGLTPGTLYGYDILLVTSTDTDAGALDSFTTLMSPTATTHGATDVTSTSATLNGTIDTDGAGTVICRFQYGVVPLTSSGAGEGLVVPCTSKASDSAAQNVSLTLKGLAPGTVYYYRVLVGTSVGADLGATVKFETKDAATAKVTAPGMKITAYAVDTKNLRASFHFSHTGDAASRGSQCGLASVTKGKVAKFTYKACKSGILYRGLKKKTEYVFYVRGGNSAGFGKAASKKFTA